jgi:hypothetical protein
MSRTLPKDPIWASHTRQWRSDAPTRVSSAYKGTPIPNPPESTISRVKKGYSQLCGLRSRAFASTATAGPSHPHCGGAFEGFPSQGLPTRGEEGAGFALRGEAATAPPRTRLFPARSHAFRSCCGQFPSVQAARCERMCGGGAWQRVITAAHVPPPPSGHSGEKDRTPPRDRCSPRAAREPTPLNERANPLGQYPECACRRRAATRALVRRGAALGLGSPPLGVGSRPAPCYRGKHREGPRTGEPRERERGPSSLRPWAVGAGGRNPRKG